MEYTSLEIKSLKSLGLSEKWVQDQIAKNPAILGLGDLKLRDVERTQASGGRLDLLLEDAEEELRYEVELQLGATDEAHIIRTIEYWDIERKRATKYDHCAVIIAEDITRRFLNVIDLFNRQIPLIAIQMKAVKIGDKASLLFTTVFNSMNAGDDEEDNEAYEPSSRETWVQDHPGTTEAAERIIGYIQSFAPGYKLKFNRRHIGLVNPDGSVNNFVSFSARKTETRLGITLPESSEITQKIEATHIRTLPYARGRYSLCVRHNEVEKHKDFLVELLKAGYEHFK